MSSTRRRFLQTLAAGSALAAGASQAAKSTRTPFDFSADIVVVGLGDPGAATAITAADNKAQVIVLERQPMATLRSNTRLSGGYIHCPDKRGSKKALLSYFTALFSGAYDSLPSVGEVEAVS